MFGHVMTQVNLFFLKARCARACCKGEVVQVYMHPYRQHACTI